MIKIVEHQDKFWGVADVYQDGTHIRTINKYFDIQGDFLTEYEASGGTGIGYEKGRPVWRKSLINKEFEIVKSNNCGALGGLMDLEKVYYDQDGNEYNILQLVKKDPEWAANRIQVGEVAIGKLSDLETEASQQDVEADVQIPNEIKVSFTKLEVESIIRQLNGTLYTKPLSEAYIKSGIKKLEKSIKIKNKK